MPIGEPTSVKQSRTASSVHDVTAEKPPFGARFLTDSSDVWSHNAWDHVLPPDDQEEIISSAIAKQRLAPVPEDDKAKYNEKPARHWDNFYKMNANNFFRNRKWLHLEFPELAQATEAEAGAVTIVEIGCGAGNAVFPMLLANNNPHLSLKAYDYSSHAVKLVQNNPLYTSPPVGSIKATVWDLSSSTLPLDLVPESVDVVVLVFVLSALHPDEWRQAVQNVYRMLKPGGLVMFRDYGRYDLTQLRFKGSRLLDDNFYIRGDKTRVYFFELDELALLFTGEPAPASSKANDSVAIVEETDALVTPFRSSRTSPRRSSSPGPSTQIHPSLQSLTLVGDSSRLFTIEQLGVDRRLIVNRKRQLKMYRVWMQAKFRKRLSYAGITRSSAVGYGASVAD